MQKTLLGILVAITLFQLFLLIHQTHFMKQIRDSAAEIKTNTQKIVEQTAPSQDILLSPGN